MDLSNVTLAQLIAPGGTALAAAVTYLVVQLLKANIPALGARVSGALQATVILAVLYVAAVVATPGAPIFTAFLYFLLADASALGIDSGVSHVQQVRTTPSGS